NGLVAVGEPEGIALLNADLEEEVELPWQGEMRKAGVLARESGDGSLGEPGQNDSDDHSGGAPTTLAATEGPAVPGGPVDGRFRSTERRVKGSPQQAKRLETKPLQSSSDPVTRAGVGDIVTYCFVSEPNAAFTVKLVKG